jgi:prepilin-type N-terminal cleavage/methylation domain-containing protein
MANPRWNGGRNQTNKPDRKQNSMLNKLNKKRGGFTLVEIMIVVAIIAR